MFYPFCQTNYSRNLGFLFAMISCLSLVLLQACGSSEEPEPAVTPPLTEKQLISMTLEFGIPSKTSIEGVVDEKDKTITFTIGLYHDLEFVSVKELAISPKAQIFPDPSYHQIDFRNPVKFEVTAEDGSSVEYTVNLVRSRFEATGTEKSIYEPGEVVTVNGSNFWSRLQKATIVTDDEEMLLMEYGGSVDAHSTYIKYKLPEYLELGDYVIKVYHREGEDEPWGDPVSLPTITVDLADKSTKITALGYNRQDINDGSSPLQYEYYISVYGQFLGNASAEDIKTNAKLFLTKVGEPDNKTELEISTATTSSKLTFFYITSAKLPSFFPHGKYYLSVEYNGNVLQSDEEVNYPFFE